jgi:L-fuculose-phosphate aldolase
VWASVDPDAPRDPSAPPELPLHQAIYATRPDVNAIVHSHAPHTLVFGASDLELRPISHDGAFLAKRVDRFTATSDTVLDIGTGRAVATALAGNPCVLLRNHGGVVVGKSIRHATVYAQLLERACQLQLMAESSLTAYHSSSWTDVMSKREFVYADLSIRSYWDYCVRQILRTWPDAAGW